jgi:hypothetical protein
VGLQPTDFDPWGRPGSILLQVLIRYAVSPILPALNRLCIGAVDPGLRRDDDHASTCAQFDYTRISRDDRQTSAASASEQF